MIRPILLALHNLASRSFLWIILQAIIFSLACAGLIGWVGFSFLDTIPQYDWTWVTTVLTYIAGTGIFIGALLIVFPIAALFIGVFLEKVADIVEDQDYPGHPEARGLSLQDSLLVALKFFSVIVVLNLLLLPFYFVPGLNVVLALLVNGYLVSREYFELVALRHRSRGEVKALRRTYRGQIFAFGLIIALALTIPLVNLIAPLFGVALMVHVYKELDQDNLG